MPGVGWFAVGGGEEPTITRYSLDGERLVASDRISLALYGVESLWDTLYVVPEHGDPRADYARHHHGKVFTDLAFIDGIRTRVDIARAVREADRAKLPDAGEIELFVSDGNADIVTVLEAVMPGEAGVSPEERTMLKNILALRGRRSRLKGTSFRFSRRWTCSRPRATRRWTRSSAWSLVRTTIWPSRSACAS